MINNRQAGRRRGRGGNGNGQRPGGNPGRPDNGNRIDNRARGNANQLYEKYKNLASDAQRQGDRVNTEYYLQFADHYFRVLNENRSRFEEQPRRARDDNYVNGFDNEFDDGDDYGDEGEPIRAGDQGEQPRRSGEQGDAPPRRTSEQGSEQPRRNVDQGGEQARREGQRRDGNGERGSDRGRDRRERRDEERAGERFGQDAAEVVDARPATPQVANDVEAEGPAESRRRGRPRRERAPELADGPGAIEADRLPPALSVNNDLAGNDAGEAMGDAPKPRRRRVRPAQDEAPAA